MLDITIEVLALFQKSGKKQKKKTNRDCYAEKVNEVFSLNTSYLIIRRAYQKLDGSGFEIEPEILFVSNGFISK
jgi:hypothetical protein